MLVFDAADAVDVLTCPRGRLTTDGGIGGTEYLRHRARMGFKIKIKIKIKKAQVIYKAPGFTL